MSLPDVTDLHLQKTANQQVKFRLFLSKRVSEGIFFLGVGVGGGGFAFQNWLSLYFDPKYSAASKNST